MRGSACWNPRHRGHENQCDHESRNAQGFCRLPVTTFTWPFHIESANSFKYASRRIIFAASIFTTSAPCRISCKDYAIVTSRTARQGPPLQPYHWCLPPFPRQRPSADANRTLPLPQPCAPTTIPFARISEIRLRAARSLTPTASTI